jgi:hypothetical protein
MKGRELHRLISAALSASDEQGPARMVVYSNGAG